MLSHGPDIEAANVGAVTAEEYARRCAQRLRADQTLVRELIEAAFAGEPINAALVSYARSLRSRVRLAALTNTWSFGRTLIHPATRHHRPLRLDCHLRRGRGHEARCTHLPDYVRSAMHEAGGGGVH